jgi:hypothetical protein
VTDIVAGLATLRCGLDVYSVSNSALLRSTVLFLERAIDVVDGDYVC